jgi:Ca2+-binding RTX toxin-like protein
MVDRVGNDSNNTINGTTGNDRLAGLGGNDTINGLAGNDLLSGGPGADNLNGGAGNDTVTYNSLTLGTPPVSVPGSIDGVIVNLATGTGFDGDAQGDKLTSIENVIGSDAYYADELTGNDAANRLEGRGGYDTLTGGRGNDTLLGGNESDQFIWNNGDGSDFVDGGTDFDNQAVNRNPNLASGADNFVVSASDTQVRINSGTTQIRLVNVENLEFNGQAGNDRLTVNSTAGTALTNISFYGGDGNDTVNAAGATVAIYAFDDVGNDTLTGGSADDSLSGGLGNDRLLGGAGNDSLSSGLGNDQVSGGAGNDQLYNDGGADQLFGDAGDDYLSNAAGNSEMRGGTGNDYLFGGLGNQQMFGDAGIDRLFGEDGDDQRKPATKAPFRAPSRA